MTMLIHLVLVATLAFQDYQKPDLTIESVSFQWQKNPHGPGPIRSGDNRPFGVFTLIVRNVGTKEIQAPFYISLASRDEDIRRKYYPSVQQVNSEELPISIGQTLAVKVYYTPYHNDPPFVRFFISWLGRKHADYDLQAIEELRTDNNTFDYKLSLDSK